MGRRTQDDLAGLILAGILAIVVSVLSMIASAISEIGSMIRSHPEPILITAFALVGGFLSYLIYDFLYFKSKEFKSIKSSIYEFINNCNELNHHIAELKGSHVSIKSYDYGTGSLKDESNYNFKRREWNKDIKNKYIHHCSSAVCKNAHAQPLKYLCKYFDIKISEESLSNIESVLNDFAAAEQGKLLLQSERDSILGNIKSSIPWIINTFSKKKLIKELGFEDIDLSDLYFPVYTFQYVSSGGNSSMKCDIKLNIENLDSLISYMRGLIKFKKSIEGQRALMTSSLREKIKTRDDYTCQICGLSTYDEQNLLLEIDHIIPLSKGGVTSEENLQTLCWRCNRSKGAKRGII